MVLRVARELPKSFLAFVLGAVSREHWEWAGAGGTGGRETSFKAVELISVRENSDLVEWFEKHLGRRVEKTWCRRGGKRRCPGGH